MKHTIYTLSIPLLAPIAAVAPASAQSLFEPEVGLVRTGTSITDVAKGDVTGNGLPDLIHFELGQERFYISEGLGQAEFDNARPVDFAVGALSHPVTGDFDQDGDVDFAVALGDAGAQSIAIITNQQGGLWTVRTVDAGPFQVEALLGGDTDSDGDPDLVAVTASGEIFAFRTVGAGFARSTVSTGGAEDATLADLNVDGSSDILFFDGPSAEWRVALGTPAAPPAAAQAFLPPSIDDYRNLAVGDLDGDGDSDLLLTVPAANPAPKDRLIAMENLGALQFGSPFALSLPWRADQGDLQLHDFNGDGLADPTYTPSTSTAGILNPFIQLNLGGFNLAGPIRLLPTSASGLQDVNFLDVKSDGRIDIWKQPSMGTEAELLTRNDADKFSWFDGSTVLFPLTRYISNLILTDVDQDNDLDIVFSSGNPRQVDWLRNRGGLHFDQPTILFPVSDATVPLVAGDFDGDGIDDLIVGSTVPIVPASAARHAVRFGLGAGQYSPPIPAGDRPLTSATVLLVADRDGDGRDNVVVNYASGAGSDITEWTFTGQGTSITETLLTTLNWPANIVLADFSSDGIEDITLSALQGTFISLGQPGGGFANPFQFNGGSLAYVSPFALDVDLDGDIDLVTRSSQFGLGWAESEYPFGMNPLAAFPDPSIVGFRSYSTADVDGDGLGDILAFSPLAQGAPSVQAFVAQPGGSFLPAVPVISAADTVSNHTFFRDLDGDGDLEALSIAFQNTNVLLSENSSVPMAGEADPGCSTGNVNSAGRRGEVLGYGSDSITSTDLRLVAINLPTAKFGFFVGSQSARSPMAVPGSAGAICLGGSIGRYDAPSQIKNSGLAGSFAIDLNPMTLEVGGGQVPAVAGQAWYFQAWHRDVGAQGATSNLTNSRRIVFTP